MFGGLAQNVGKFASDGERYFDRTWKKAELRTREKIYDKTVGKRKAAKAAADDSSDTAETFGNVVFVPGEGDTEKAEPVPMQLIVVNLLERVGKDLHKTASKLFAHVQGETKIDWLPNTASLFGWIQSKLGTINWNRGNNLVTKDEFAAELLRCVSPVAAVEKLPHFPPIDGHYYLCPPPTPGDGEALAKLIDRYKFATEYDRELATAMFVTAVWGGPPGCRPAWLITSQLGRGRGKSTLAQHMAEMFGGCVDISPNEDITVVKKRLLSKEAEFVRVGLLDNLKSTRFSWGEFEAMLTSTEINGWEVYVGDSRRPNLLTWIITLNGASLSTDMAQRVIEIQLGEPSYTETWEEDSRKLIESTRPAVIADCVAFLQRPAKRMKSNSRWATWEGAVLSRCDHPDECFDLIKERRGAVDVEEEESEIIESYFAGRLEWLGYNPDTVDVFIPNDLAAQWYNKATGDNRKTTGVTRSLKQLHDEKKIHRLQPYRTTDAGRERGFRWCGPHVVADTEYDIRYRLAKKLEEQNEKRS